MSSGGGDETPVAVVALARDGGASDTVTDDPARGGMLHRAIGEEVARRCRGVFLAGSVAILFFGTRQVIRGTPSVWLLIEALDIWVIAAVLYGSRSRLAHAHALSWGATVMACTSLLHFGPLMGTGVFFSLAILLATFFFGRLGAGMTLVSMAVTVTICLVTDPQGFSVRFGFAPLDWARVSVASALALVAASLLFELVKQRASTALANEQCARAAEEEMHSERQRMLEQSLHSQRLESLGRLAGGVAHDFNNSLTVIQNGIEILRTCEPAEREELLLAIDNSAKSAAATAGHLMAFARDQPLDHGTCDAQQLLERLALSLGRLLPETIQLSVTSRVVAPIAMATPVLEQVVLNLVVNSRAAIEDCGAILLSCEMQGEEVVVAVADDGVGMDPATARQIFEPFFTTKGDSGTGLGLAMVWAVVTRHGGTVSVESALGEGTRLELRMPRATVAEVEQEQMVSRPTRRAGCATILVLEDQREVRRMLSRILTREGFDVTAVESSVAAHVELERRTFDMLITDGVVPGGGVPKVIETFRAQRADAPVLVCSGHLEEELLVAGITSREYRFLRKPFSVDELLSALPDLA